MSTEAVNQFLQKVGEDRELQQELTQALSSENQQQAATELANKNGYECSADELWTELENIQSEFQAKLDSGEITEEQLEAIAGGSKSKWIATGVKYVAPALIAATGVLGAAGINKS